MTDSQSPRFNLVDEPWINVRYLDGRSLDVSLRTAFHDASRIRDIGGELPTQTFALTRLLLAILYRATADESDAGWSRDAWHEDWVDGLPLEDIDAYLAHFHDRFWLLHPTRPFFQVAGLATAKGEVKDTAPLILDLPSNNRLFTTRSGKAAMRLPFAEAARWLVNAQAFDASGIKSGAVGDPRVKGGKGYPIGVAWSGLLGGVLLEGAALDRTLLLNLVLPHEVPGFSISKDRDVPTWERDDADTSADRGEPPRGPAGLLTWQSRRIRLEVEDDRVIGCVLANGDALTPQNQFSHEPMSAWRYSEPQTKRAGTRTYMPKEHQPHRAFWRGISALLSQHDESVSMQPATFVALAKRKEDLVGDLQVRVRAVGVVYGSNNSVVDDVIDDQLSISTALLRAENAELATEAERAVRLADEGVLALKRLAQNLDRAAGGTGETAWSRADSAAYAALDGHYRSWLAGLDATTDASDAITDWKRSAYGVIRDLGADLIRFAGPAAWAGREVSTLKGPEYITTPRAEAWFLRALHTIFGDQTPQLREEISA